MGHCVIPSFLDRNFATNILLSTVRKRMCEENTPGEWMIPIV